MTDDGYRDELPAELDVSGFVGPYTFPNNNRRRVAGAIYLTVAVAIGALVAVRGNAVLVNRGMAGAAIGLALIGGYHLFAGQTLRSTATDALVAAVREV